MKTKIFRNYPVMRIIKDGLTATGHCRFRRAKSRAISGNAV